MPDAPQRPARGRRQRRALPRPRTCPPSSRRRPSSSTAEPLRWRTIDDEHRSRHRRGPSWSNGDRAVGVKGAGEAGGIWSTLREVCAGSNDVVVRHALGRRGVDGKWLTPGAEIASEARAIELAGPSCLGHASRLDVEVGGWKSGAVDRAPVRSRSVRRHGRNDGEVQPATANRGLAGAEYAGTPPLFGAVDRISWPAPPTSGWMRSALGCRLQRGRGTGGASGRSSGRRFRRSSAPDRRPG